MITLLVFLGTILVLVAAHEGGHFLAAKATHVYVKESSIGFGPRLASRKGRETTYSLRAFPIGGYVRLGGEDGVDAPPDVSSDRLLYSNPPLIRIVVSLAGPAANLLMTLVVSLIVLWGMGTPILQVAGLVPDGPAAAALEPGDRVLGVDGHAVYTGQALSRAINRTQGKPATFAIKRGSERLNVTVTPGFDAGEGRYMVGVYFMSITFTNEITVLSAGSPLAQAGLESGDRIVAVAGKPIQTGVDLVNRLDGLLPAQSVSLSVARAAGRLDLAVATGGLTVEELLAGATFGDLGTDSRRPGPFAGLVLGAGQFAEGLNLMGQSVKGILTGRVSAGEAFSGPVGIARVLGEGISQGASVFLRLFSLLSLSLGLFNLIPFPALDGSRAAFALYELVRGKRIPPQREGLIHAIGFLVLIALMILVTYQDILKLFR